jgi:glycosyltransferase involved in cell wall biosynthesis
MNKILIVAHELSPNLGSECRSGWSIVKRLAKKNQIIVIYAHTNQLGSECYADHLQPYISEYETLGCEFIAVSYPKVTKHLLKFGALFSRKGSVVGNQVVYFINYSLWHRKVKKVISSTIQMNDIKLIHLLNHISYREPGRLLGFNKPFVWGPISGLAPINFQYLKNYPIRHRATMLLRKWSSYFVLMINRRIGYAAKKASWLFCVTKEDLKNLASNRAKTSVLLDVGSDIVPRVKREDINGRLIRIILVGRLDFNKGIDILLNALVSIENWSSKYEITIIGTGPEAQYFQDMAISLGLHKINWLGAVMHSEVGRHMNLSDLLIHTSIKEAGCSVVLEALAHGLPVISHDAFGMAHEIDDRCGIKISYVDPETSTLELAGALNMLNKYPLKLIELSDGAYLRAKELSWDYLVNEIEEVYSRVC